MRASPALVFVQVEFEVGRVINQQKMRRLRHLESAEQGVRVHVLQYFAT